jgi:hypothetical protein
VVYSLLRFRGNFTSFFSESCAAMKFACRSILGVDIDSGLFCSSNKLLLCIDFSLRATWLYFS